MGGPLLGVDMGGTWIRAAVVSPDGTCGPVRRLPTRRNRETAEILGDLKALLTQCRDDGLEFDRKAEGIAMGVPTVPGPDGTLTSCDNLPGMGGFEMRRYLEETMNLPVFLFNDANCFAAGEWWMGAGRGTVTFCGVTLGTGIGLGLVIDGHEHSGVHGHAGELWKSPVRGGTLEQHVSGGALEKRYETLSGRTVDGPSLAALARGGDVAAIRAYAEFGRALGEGLCWVVNILDPECIAFGGSISESFEFFKGDVVESLRSGTMVGDRVVLRQSLLGEKAALLGAAHMTFAQLSRP